MPHLNEFLSAPDQSNQQSKQMLAIIFDYMAKMSIENDIEKLLMHLADLGTQLVSADRCTVWLHRPTERTLWTVAGHGVEKVVIPEGSGFVGYSVKTGEPVIVKEAYEDDRFNDAVDRKTGYRTHSVLCIPFRNAEGKVIGAFQAINKLTEPGMFTQKDYEVLTFASTYAGKSLEASILRSELIETQKEIIETMGEIGESRSQETGHHVKRVAKYSYLLARLSGMPAQQALMFKYASPMHDIGKVAIPDSILLKPGKLTEEEFALMKEHTTIGYNIFKHSQRELLRTAAVIAHEHHERWDGKGYPNGRKGKEIHLFGRITAIADVFDALGSDRVYKKAWSIERIMEYMVEQRGKQFDPKLTDLFLEHIDQFIAIRNQYADR